MTARIRTVALLLVAAVVTGYGYQSSPVNRPWPPGVQKVPDESPPLSPEDALKTFYMAPGYRVELVAAEPLIQEPVAIDWDLEGRLWAVEMPGFMRDVAGSDEHDPVGRVVVLEDTNRDGRMDKRTVFADGLVLARAVKVLDRGVLVGEPPNAWLMRDTNGDLRMDTKELVTAEYGRRDVDPENNANGFYWALDNRMHTAGQVDVYLRLKNGTFEVLRTLRRGEWGVTQDDAGRIYRNTNESALHVDLVPTPYFARNPNLLRTRGSYERLANDNSDLNVVWPVRPNPGTNRAYQTGIDRADGTLAKFTTVCAPLVYRGDRLPADLYGNVFVAEPGANLVSRIILNDDGATLGARKAYDAGEFLASTDERFRPVYLSNAPDGTLYIADLYRGILQHRVSLTVYLRDYILRRNLEKPAGLGRIYRVVHETTRRDNATALSAASPAQLVEALSHPNGWWRETAQRLLVERGEKSAAPALLKLVDGAKDWRTRLHALWTLDGIDSIERATVTKALEDSSRDVRASAIRIAERWLGEAGDPIQAAVLKRLDDGDWAVRQQLAASLGALPPGPRESAVLALLERHGNDPIAMDAALSGVRGSEAAILERLLQAPRCSWEGAGGPVCTGPGTDRSARKRHHHALRDDRAGRAGCGHPASVRVGRRPGPPGLAAVGASARRGGCAPRSRDARHSGGRKPWRGGDAGRGVAVPDMSWRARRSGGRVCVSCDECPRSRRQRSRRRRTGLAAQSRAGGALGVGRARRGSRSARAARCWHAWRGRASRARPRRSRR